MKKIHIVMAVLATAALASCQQEKSFNDEKLGENSVVFTISGAATRAADSTPTVRQGVVIPLETEDGSKFSLEESVVNLNEIGPETKGTPAYTENVGTLYANNLSVWGDSPKFQPAATYDNMETSMYARKDKNQGEGWRYQHNYSGDPWPNKTTQVGFYLNMPATLLESSSLNIKGRSGGAFTFDYTSPTTASKQEDLLFAYRAMSKEEHMGYLPNGAPVLFNHALTGVKFAIGNDLETENVAITSVTFVGLKNKATNITMTPVGAKVDDTENEYTDKIDHYTSAGTVDWSSATADPTTNEISETYEGVTTYATGAGSFGTGKGNYPQSFSAAGNKNNLGSSDGSQIFWLIPQTFAATSEVKLRIAYTYGNNSGEWTIDFGSVLGQKGVEWKAGELRTYTIKVDEVNVKIEDVVNPTATPNTALTTIDGTKEIKDKNGNTVLYTAYGGTKSNVTITNTGNTDAYIRAALIGQWLDEKGNPVFGFTDYTAGRVELVDSWYQDQFVSHNGYHGYFVDLPGYQNTQKDSSYDNPLNNWYLNSDGYYYYKEIVPAGESVPKDLFTSYTVSRSPAVLIAGAVKNVYFRLEISTQAISAKQLDGTPYSLSEAWRRAGVTVSAE